MDLSTSFNKQWHLKCRDDDDAGLFPSHTPPYPYDSPPPHPSHDTCLVFEEFTFISSFTASFRRAWTSDYKKSIMLMRPGSETEREKLREW